jgi:hypothetical protein
MFLLTAFRNYYFFKLLVLKLLNQIGTHIYNQVYIYIYAPIPWQQNNARDDKIMKNCYTYNFFIPCVYMSTCHLRFS